MAKTAKKKGPPRKAKPQKTKGKPNKSPRGPISRMKHNIYSRGSDIHTTAAVKTKAKSRIVNAYDYRDEGGELLYQAVRQTDKKGEKKFAYRRPNPKNPPDPENPLDPNDPDDRFHWLWEIGEDTRRVLYRLPDLLDPVIIGLDQQVFIVEGEKDVDRLWQIGLSATTNPMGAGKWRPEYSDFLNDRRVVIVLDNDKAGREHAESVAESLSRAGTPEIKVLDLSNIPPGLAEGGDISDWLDQGGTKQKLVNLAKDTLPWAPDLQAVQTTKKFWPTDIYNAGCFVARYGDNVRYCWKWGWLFYDNKRWNRKEGNAAAEKLARAIAESLIDVWKRSRIPEQKQVILRWFVRSQHYRQITAMLMTARSYDKISTYPEWFDSDIYLFNCDNGTIDLRTGGFREHRPADMITKLAPVTYDPKAGCDLWLSCLDTWMQGDTEKIDYLQRLMGMCLTGDICARAFPIFHGSGKNGKSVFLDTIRELMGDYAITAPEDLLMEKQYHVHPTEIASLVGRRLVTLDETKPNMKLRTSLVKRMTGDRTLQARFMRQDYFEFHTTNKTILVTQNLPRITETADAIWDRLHLVPWIFRIPDREQNPHLLDELRAEWPGIFNWLIDGCSKWQKEGYKLPPPDVVKTATEKYRRESDPLSDFCDENVLFNMPAESRIRKSELRERYDWWAKENNVKFPVSNRYLSEYLRARGVRDGQAKIDGKNLKVWYGIGLQTQL
ncbi:MAG: hypothetical protein CEE41_05310 [Hadesarchaea archaeon B3_Hades]|nr:MAG: hypothetical protein CEE41_05310 [Hadesarchaea archaeon B3_Hades]